MDPAGTIARLQPLLLSVETALDLEPPAAVESAVLVPLTDDNGVLSVILTRRRDDLRHHAGEYSFPGGRRDPGEENLLVTALRETHEEIGIPPTQVQLIGALQPTATIATGFSVHPFVGVVPTGTALIAAPDEVAEILLVPLADLIAGADRAVMKRRDLAFRTAVFPLDDRVIWGATARILFDLLARIGPASA
ncbi:MAG: CoA pyrophosphatase [Solirubrobacterales bacterium]|nr:CoA pyrophosphatase [Solirubrobacterales bacterium]